ncbi:hypothetical protein Q8A67_019808 [Cirrhinus molitorella]|uniref:Uncharacterized protein n=1 Tax=Cirrhinus molitorella TaxID=172907 RepID=A0AA88PEK8_9TELE|nr:hypothetical protein Q8A67_019808 [Cirrhinus molitorella]
MGVCVCERSRQSYFHTLLEWQFDNDDTTAINPILFLFKHQPAPAALTVENRNSLAELHNLSPALKNEIAADLPVVAPPVSVYWMLSCPFKLPLLLSRGELMCLRAGRVVPDSPSA